MSTKALRRALYGLVVVLVLYGATTFLGRDRGDRGGSDSALQDALTALATGQTRFVIAGPEDTIRLEREAQDWSVNGFEADPVTLDDMMLALEESEVSGLISTNPANHARLAVSVDSAVAISAEGLSAVLLGKDGNRYRTAYARLSGTDDVYLIESDLRRAATLSLFAWRNKVIVEIDTERIETIRVTRGGTTTLYQKQDSTWSTGGAAADTTIVNNILQELSSLRAIGFAPEGTTMPDDSDWMVVVADAAGNELVSLTLVEAEERVRVMAAGRPYLFEIGSMQADRVAPEPPGEGQGG